MNKDRPLAEITVTEGGIFTADRIEADGKYFPLEMEKECSGYTLQRFCDERLTPRTRIGMQESLEEAGFESYSYAAVLIGSNGRDCSDPYWVRFEDGPQTWKEVWEAIGVYNKV